MVTRVVAKETDQLLLDSTVCFYPLSFAVAIFVCTVPISSGDLAGTENVFIIK